MLAAQSNVVKFENENMVILNHIQNYFNELGRKGRDFTEKNTDNTRRTYEIEIRQFFHVMRNKEYGKELEYLTQSDIEITEDIFEKYRDYLFDLKEYGKNKYTNKTINKKTAALKSFIKYLKKKKIIVTDISYLDLIKNEKEKKNHYGCLELSEVKTMMSLALEEKNKGLIKNKCIQMAFKTGLRHNELRNLKWSDFEVKENYVIVDGFGKGNKEFEIKISKEFYNELLELNQGQENVFDLSTKEITDMMTRYVRKMNIGSKRRIVFHSIRKSFGTQIYELSGKDINKARIALRHENINTTQIYLGIKDEGFDHTLLEIDKIDENLFKNVSHEELINALSNCHESVRGALNLELYKMQKENI